MTDVKTASVVGVALKHGSTNLIIHSPPFSAEIPQVINYQGKVTNSGGPPIADDDYSMTFAIYDADSGGSPLWSSGELTVAVSGGTFSALLGESPQPTLDLDFDGDYWLEIDIAGDVQSPRTRLGSVGYAYVASGVVPGTVVSGAVWGGTQSAFRGENTSTGTYTVGLWGEAVSTIGRGVLGRATATTGEAYGVLGRSFSTQGAGVYGSAEATEGTTSGIHGVSASTAGRGVFGNATAGSGTSYGVYGRSDADSGRGVCGEATATAGNTYGVYGTAASAAGYAGYFEGNARVTGNLTVDGVLSGSGMGDVTAVIAGTGLTGGATSGDATLSIAVPLALSGTTEENAIVSGTNSGSGLGVYGSTASFDGKGVFGSATSSTGDNTGVWGETWSAHWNACGVFGIAWMPGAATRGVYGSANSTSGVGVYGDNHEAGYAIYASGSFAASGAKSCVVKTSRGPTLMYCQESPENWFEDAGEGLLRDGRAHVELDPLFLETVTIDATNPMKVFVQLNGECAGVYVVKGSNKFEVVELRGGRSSTAFDYRVMAKRKGFEEKRLDYCVAAETDSYLYLN